MAKLLEIYLGKVTLHLIHRGEGMLALDKIDEELAINECLDTDRGLSWEAEDTTWGEVMLFLTIEDGLDFSTDKREVDVHTRVIMSGDALALRKRDMDEMETFGAVNVAKSRDFVSDHRDVT